LNFEGNLWIAIVNVIIWSGIFLYLLSIERRVARQEKNKRSS
jgi:CcmD family protein